MKKLRNIVVIVGIAMAFTACQNDFLFIEGYGSIVTEYLDIDAFHGIDMDGVDDVVISYGEELEVKVEGHENIIPRIQTDVHNGVWNMRLDRGNYRNYRLTYYVTMPSLSLIKVDGVAKVEVEDFINDGDLTIDLNGAGKVVLHEMENTEDIFVGIDGTGLVVFEEEISDLSDLEIVITGAGDVQCFEAPVNNCRVDIVGTGKCELYVIDELDVLIDGAATVHYKGQPSVSQNISGIGTVKNVD